MKLRNKKTGEIAEASILNFELVVRYDDGRVEKYPLLFDYSNFEYYEEPKEYWTIDWTCTGVTTNWKNKYSGDDVDDFNKSIGNYFETREEAEKAVEKLKAFKRLKDRGFRFDGWTFDDGLRISICTNTDSEGIYNDDKKEMKKDLDICFGGEE